MGIFDNQRVIKFILELIVSLKYFMIDMLVTDARSNLRSEAGMVLSDADGLVVRRSTVDSVGSCGIPFRSRRFGISLKYSVSRPMFLVPLVLVRLTRGVLNRVSTWFGYSAGVNSTSIFDVVSSVTFGIAKHTNGYLL